MISLHRNKKTGKLLVNNGIKQERYIYKSGQNEEFPISRSKFGDFLKCKRCFYLNTVKGLKEPGTPGWSLNSATDELLKNEFDEHRKNQTQHQIMIDYNLKNIFPFQHKDLDKWRDSLHYGFMYIHKDLNLKLKGGIDDLWFDKKTSELIIVDYKSTSTSKYEINEKNYLDDPFHDDYKNQMNFYGYIFEKGGFKVKTTYFLVVNGLKNGRFFNNELKFKPTLVEYKPQTDHVEEKLEEMKSIMDDRKIPPARPECENCSYLTEGSNILKNIQKKK